MVVNKVLEQQPLSLRSSQVGQIITYILTVFTRKLSNKFIVQSLNVILEVALINNKATLN